MKNPLTPAGIEPVTFRFVAHHVNHCATASVVRKACHVAMNAGLCSILLFKEFCFKFWINCSGVWAARIS